MATEGFIQVPADSTGKRVDAASVDDGGVSVYRQKMVICGASGSAEVVATSLSAPAASACGLVVRQAGAISVNGGVAISGTAIVAGSVVISGTATVAGVVGLTAGTANIGSINNISATVTVAGVIALSAGAANIGHINHISATVVAAIARMYVNTANNSASRGPRCVNVSTSANTTLVAAPGAGMAIYVTAIGMSNASGTNTRGRFGTSASIGTVQMMMAASGGGFVMQFTPPWELTAGEALVGSVKPSVSEAIANIHFFVASADAL